MAFSYQRFVVTISLELTCAVCAHAGSLTAMRLATFSI